MKSQTHSATSVIDQITHAEKKIATRVKLCETSTRQTRRNKHKTMEKTLEKPNREVAETLQSIVSRVKRNLGKMQEIIKSETYNLRLEIGRDLIAARNLCQKSKITFKDWLADNFDMSSSTAYDAMKIAGSSSRSQNFTSITEHLRHHRPTYAMPRQSVGEDSATKKILGGISNDIFFERAREASKELQVKKKMAIELVDAGFRALSIKAHTDKGGSDDAMVRLNEVRKALKNAIEDEVIDF
jgi:hypothetical protein